MNPLAGAPYGLTDPFGSIGAFLSFAINALMGISFSIALLSIGYSAFLYAMSAGDPKAVKAAFNTFVWGVIAAGITLLALVLKVIVVNQIIGVTSPDIRNDAPSF